MTALRPDSTGETVRARPAPAVPAAAVTEPVRVVFVGDHEIIAEGLHAMLAGRDDQVELVGHVLPRKGHLETAIRLGADVVLLESPMQGSSGLDLLAEKPPVPVVVFADDADERRLFEALRRGASGYLLKSLSAAQLVDHLARARTGEVVVDPALASRVALRSVYDGTGEAWPGRQLGLSQRESEVLALLADGLSNRLIASELIVGEETVKTHLRNIYRKLGVKDRAQAIAIAIRRGIVA